MVEKDEEEDRYPLDDETGYVDIDAIAKRCAPPRHSKKGDRVRVAQDAQYTKVSAASPISARDSSALDACNLLMNARSSPTAAGDS